MTKPEVAVVFVVTAMHIAVGVWPGQNWHHRHHCLARFPGLCSKSAQNTLWAYQWRQLSPKSGSSCGRRPGPWAPPSVGRWSAGTAARWTCVRACLCVCVCVYVCAFDREYKLLQDDGQQGELQGACVCVCVCPFVQVATCSDVSSLDSLQTYEANRKTLSWSRFCRCDVSIDLFCFSMTWHQCWPMGVQRPWPNSKTIDIGRERHLGSASCVNFVESRAHGATPLGTIFSAAEPRYCRWFWSQGSRCSTSGRSASWRCGSPRGPGRGASPPRRTSPPPGASGATWRTRSGSPIRVSTWIHECRDRTLAVFPAESEWGGQFPRSWRKVLSTPSRSSPGFGNKSGSHICYRPKAGLDPHAHGTVDSKPSIVSGVKSQYLLGSNHHFESIFLCVFRLLCGVLEGNGFSLQAPPGRWDPRWRHPTWLRPRVSHPGPWENRTVLVQRGVRRRAGGGAPIQTRYLTCPIDLRSPGYCTGPKVNPTLVNTVVWSVLCVHAQVRTSRGLRRRRYARRPWASWSGSTTGSCVPRATARWCWMQMICREIQVGPGDWTCFMTFVLFCAGQYENHFPFRAEEQ